MWGKGETERDGRDERWKRWERIARRKEEGRREDGEENDGIDGRGTRRCGREEEEEQIKRKMSDRTKKSIRGTC